MNPNLEQQLSLLGPDTLTPVVRRALAEDDAELCDWSFSRVPTSAINPVTAGIYRFSGTARCGGGLVPWSLILKLVRRLNLGDGGKGYVDDPADWNYWKREGLVYRSGILDGWRGGLAPVKCHAVLESPTGLVWMWLEECREPNISHWSVARHVLAARHLGEFNGAHVGYVAALGDDAWICRRFVRQWMHILGRSGLAQVAHAADFWNHPYARLAFAADARRRLLGLIVDADVLCDRLERQAQTLSHQDAHQSNLFVAQDDHGREQTRVIDWSFLGIAAVGEDLGTQIGGNLFRLLLDPAQADTYYAAAFEAYLEGLRAAGWDGDAQRVRFACAAAAGVDLFITNDDRLDGKIVPGVKFITSLDKAFV